MWIEKNLHDDEQHPSGQGETSTHPFIPEALPSFDSSAGSIEGLEAGNRIRASRSWDPDEANCCALIRSLYVSLCCFSFIPKLSPIFTLLKFYIL